MTYKDLTLNQRIGLKDAINTMDCLKPYKAVWILWNFRVAIDLFFIRNEVDAANYLYSKLNP